MRSIWIPVLILGILILLLGGHQSTAGDLSPRPLDTLEQGRLRVWIPVEGSTRCRVTVTVKNRRNHTVRTLVDRVLSPDYYNVYWDKKDDSGRWVDPGTYRYDLDICGRCDEGELTVVYAPGERECTLVDSGERYPKSVRFRLSQSGLPVTIRVFDFQRRLMTTAVYDSTFAAGEHRWQWDPGPEVVHGRYEMLLRVAEAEFRDTLWCTR